MMAGDITDSVSTRIAVEGVDCVVHAAAIVNAPCQSEYMRVNRDGTENLARAAASVKRFIYISSLDIDSDTLYGKSKLAGEEALKAAGVPYTILRPGPLYGPGDTKNIMSIYLKARKGGILPVIGDGRYLRQPLFVDDLCEMTLAVIKDAKSAGKTYYVGGPKITYDEMMGVIAALCEKRPKIIHVPARVGKMMIRAAKLAGLFAEVSDDQINTIDTDKTGPMERFNKTFGFAPKSFAQGMKLTAQELSKGLRGK